MPPLARSKAPRLIDPPYLRPLSVYQTSVIEMCKVYPCLQRHQVESRWTCDRLDRRWTAVPFGDGTQLFSLTGGFLLLLLLVPSHALLVVCAELGPRLTSLLPPQRT